MKTLRSLFALALAGLSCTAALAQEITLRLLPPDHPHVPPMPWEPFLRDMDKNTAL